MIVADGLDDTVRAGAVRDFQHPLHGVLLCDVHGIVRSQLASNLQAEWLKVGDHGQAGASAVAQDVEYRKPQFSGPQDGHAFSRLHPPALQDVVPQAIHLDHRRKSHGDAIGQRVDAVGGRGDVLPKTAVQVYAQQFERAAGVEVS